MDKEVRDYISKWHHERSVYQDYPQKLKIFEKLKEPEILGFKYANGRMADKAIAGWKKILNDFCADLNKKFTKSISYNSY